MKALRHPLVLVLLAVVLVVSAGVVFNAVYWPFSDSDALAIYAPLARGIYESGALPSGSLYEGYPMMVPLAYAYTHWAAGGVRESWARLVPAMMALGAVGASAALGREMRSWRVGLAAAGLVILTPLYCRWASTGYVDVPAAFSFGLSALGAWRWSTSRTPQDALLTGLGAGLAMWTKSSTLTLGISLVALIAFAAWRDVPEADRPSRHGWWPAAAWMVGGVLVTAGPWYARNLAVMGFLIPDTIWTNQARHDLSSLFVILDPRSQFSVPGWIFTASLVYAGARVALEGARRTPAWLVLLGWIGPFVAAWWWMASYDSRFLVTVVPLLAVTAALMLDDVRRHLSDRLSARGIRAAALVASLLVLAMAPFALQKAVEGKRAILQDPSMTDEVKHRVLLGGVYDIALAINRLPPGSRILGVPSLSRYHIDAAHRTAISEAQTEQPPWEQTSGYDYVIYRFAQGQEPEWAVGVKPILETPDGYFLYATADDARAPSLGAATPTTHGCARM
jgi:hypothetical protein